MCCSVRVPCKSHGALQMLFVRYIVGGQAELSAADILSLDDKATGQEGGTIGPVRLRVVHKYLIDTMRELKVDEASTVGVMCLNADATQAE